MYYLGIQHGHNGTVALVKDGELIFCQSEERFDRLKNSLGMPVETIKYIYENIVSPDKIEYVVLTQKTILLYTAMKERGFSKTSHGDFVDSKVFEFAQQMDERMELYKKDRETYMKMYHDFLSKMENMEKDETLRKEAYSYYESILKIPASRIIELDHHTSHAFSAVANVSTESETVLFTLDGEGDELCATVGIWDGKKYRRLCADNKNNSLGYVYSFTTRALGMRMLDHEFKVMGLAPYSKSGYYKEILGRLSELINITDDGRWKCKPENLEILQYEMEKLYKYRRFDNIAGAVQELTENLMIKWVKYWVEKTGIKKIAVSGGVFMNVKACQRIAEMPEIEDFFIVPSAADESTAIGAAFYGNLQFQPDEKLSPLKSLYLGVTYNEKDIEKAMEKMNCMERYDIIKHDDTNKQIAKLLADGEIVARCTGRMEFGARALGNRSILAKASDREVVRFINEAVKNRDFWMPFAPSILEEDMPRYIKNPEGKFAPYMTIAFDSTEEGQKHLAAAMHPYDFSLRPQCVRKEWNPDYYEIIHGFKELTGMGGILNTSFNLHGEPIVCSPEDAIRTVDSSGLKYLSMGKYLLKKKN